jgi:protein-serine/threonine kinase
LAKFILVLLFFAERMGLTLVIRVSLSCLYCVSIYFTITVGTEDYISPEIISGVAQSSAVDWWTLGILIYEMLTGTTPFKGSHADETFSNIVHHQVKWPEDLAVSADCKHLVKRLLRREPDKRLGALNGATDIKRSKWFANVTFALVRNETPPIIPKIRDPQDFSQYAGFVSGEFDEANALAEGESGDFDNNNPENPFMDFNIRRDSEIVQRKY